MPSEARPIRVPGHRTNRTLGDPPVASAQLATLGVPQLALELVELASAGLVRLAQSADRPLYFLK